MKKFIQFSHDYYKKGDLHLNPKQWYILSLIALRVDLYFGYVETSIDLLTQVQTIFKNSNSNKNKKMVTDIVKELVGLGVIEIINTSEYGYSSLLQISVKKYTEGFTQINYELMKQAKDQYELYLLSIVEGYKRGFKKSYEELALLLGIKETKTREVVSNLAERNLIRADRKVKRTDEGTFVSTPYTFYPVKEPIVQDAPEREKPKVQPEPVLVDGEETRKHQWYEKGSDIRFDDYDFYVYETTIDQNLRNAAEKKIKVLESRLNNDKNKKAWDYIQSVWDKGRERAHREQREKEAEERQRFIQSIPSEKNFVLRDDNQIVIIDNIDDLFDSDELYDDNNNKRYVKSLKLGHGDISYRVNLEESDKEVFEENFKRLLLGNKFTQDLFKEHLDFIDNYLEERNRGRDYRTVWVGDLCHSLDGVAETNSSRERRIKEARKKNQLEQSKLHNDIDISSLFD